MLTAIRSQIFKPALALCALALVAAASVPNAVAQTFPAKPVRSVARIRPAAARTR